MGSVPFLALLLLATGPAEYAIGPGFEKVFSTVMPAREGELPQGWALRRLSVPQTRVEALYGPAAGAPVESCEKAPLCVELVHPSRGEASIPAAGLFGFRVRRADPSVDPAALLTGLRGRLGATSMADPWKKVQEKLPPPPKPPPRPADASPPPDMEGRFGALLDSDRDLRARLVSVEVVPTAVRYRLRGDDGQVAVVELLARTPRQSHPNEVTLSYYVHGLGTIPDPPDLVARVIAGVA